MKEDDKMQKEPYKTLEDILRIYFGCKNPFSAKQKICFEDGIGQHFAKKGYESYCKLITLLYDLQKLNILCDAERSEFELDRIVRFEE